MIKDSGSRTEFATGAVRDIQKGKGRCDLMPFDIIAECYSREFPNNVTGKIFSDIHSFANTGDYRYLCDALSRKEPFDSWADMFLEVSMHFEEGAEKYGENNWQKGLPVKCYINSAVRHYLKWLRGDTDEAHDKAFCWNIICACWTCKHKPELNSYGMKKCPVCGEPLPIEAKFCGNCQVTIEKTDFDPDLLMGEYEEENE